MAPSATTEQLNTAVTENSAQRTKDRAINEQTLTDTNGELSSVVEYVTKLNDTRVGKAMTHGVKRLSDR